MLPLPPILVGRERELERLAAALALVAVAVIDGIAGVGKSTLARAAATRWAGPVAVTTIDRSPTIAALSEAVHRQLGVARPDLAAGDDECLRQLWRLLDAQGALLVVDDLQLWGAGRRGALVRNALRGLRRGRMLAVSRELVPLRPDDPDRVQLRLEGLDRVAAEQLWETLTALYGPARDFEAAWQRSRGNPFLLRQAHVGRAEHASPLDGLLASLTAAERALASLIAMAQAPLPATVLEAAGCDPAALQTLATRLVVDLDPEGNYAVHALVRDHLLRTSQRAGAPLLIDATCHELRLGGVLLCSLATRTSLRTLLYAFAAAPDGALDRDAIAGALWSAAYDPLRHESSIKSSIRRLRALLDGSGATIEAATDGYRLRLPPRATFQRAGCSASQRSTRDASLRVLGVA